MSEVGYKDQITKVLKTLVFKAYATHGRIFTPDQFAPKATWKPQLMDSTFEPYLSVTEAKDGKLAVTFNSSKIRGSSTQQDDIGLVNGFIANITGTDPNKKVATDLKVSQIPGEKLRYVVSFELPDTLASVQALSKNYRAALVQDAVDALTPELNRAKAKLVQALGERDGNNALKDVINSLGKTGPEVS